MKEQCWIFSVCIDGDIPPSVKRVAVVGPARPSTVEKALHLAGAPEDTRSEIRADKTVRKFIEGALDPEWHGYYISRQCPEPNTHEVFWSVCIGPVHEVIR